MEEVRFQGFLFLKVCNKRGPSITLPDSNELFSNSTGGTKRRSQREGRHCYMEKTLPSYWIGCVWRTAGTLNSKHGDLHAMDHFSSILVSHVYRWSATEMPRAHFDQRPFACSSYEALFALWDRPMKSGYF